MRRSRLQISEAKEPNQALEPMRMSVAVFREELMEVLDIVLRMAQLRRSAEEIGLKGDATYAITHESAPAGNLWRLDRRHGHCLHSDRWARDPGTQHGRSP